MFLKLKKIKGTKSLYLEEACLSSENGYEHSLLSLLPQMFIAFCWSVLLISFLYIQLREFKPAASSVKPPKKEYVLVIMKENEIRRDQYLMLRNTAILALQLATNSKSCILGNEFRKHVPQVTLG